MGFPALKEVEITQEISNDISVSNRKLSEAEYYSLIVDNREYGKRLAWSFLSSWRIRLEQDEVISIVGAALCEAACRFDPDKKVNFRTFFFYHLRGMLLKEISANIQDQKTLQFSIDCPEIGSESTALLSKTTHLIENSTPEELIGKKQLSTACLEACNALDDLEQEVLVRFFFNDEPLVQVAQELDYCRCHISRVKRRALKKMAAMLTSVVKEEVIDGESEDLPTAQSLAAQIELQKKRYTGGRGRRKKSAMV